MKIAIDCHTLEIKNWAGKEQFLFLLIKNLIKSPGNDKYILYFRRRVKEIKDIPANFKIKNINLPTPFWHIYVLINILINKIDYILCPCAYLLPAINIFIPSILIVHDITAFLPKTKIYHNTNLKFRELLLARRAMKNSKKIITVSHSTKNDLNYHFKIPSDKIVVIYPAIDQRFKVTNNLDRSDKILAKYSLPKNYVLFVGTIEPRKNIINLIKGFKNALSSIDSSFKLVIVGKKGWNYDNIFNLAKEEIKNGLIIFTGYIPDDDMPYIYNMAKCFIYPSYYEGFGLPLLEAMACKCPVITSNISSMPEVVSDAAILINPDKVEEITEAINRILNDNNLRQDLAKKSLNQAKKFSWEVTIKNIISVINNLN